MVLKLKKNAFWNFSFFKYCLPGGIFIFFIVLSSCERQDPWESFDCSTCYADKPDWGPLSITLTINGQNLKVPIVIYRGDLEDNKIEYVDTAVVSDYTVDVPVDQYYSVTAEYSDDGKTTFAVDGDKLKLAKNSKDCDTECYYFKGGHIDVRLRK